MTSRLRVNVLYMYVKYNNEAMGLVVSSVAIISIG